MVKNSKLRFFSCLLLEKKLAAPKNCASVASEEKISVFFYLVNEI